MNKNIFITASTGNIGSQIVRNLTALDISFTAGINSKEIESNQAYINFDDEKSLEKAFENTETLFLLFPMHPKMTDWAKNAVNAAKKAKVKHIVRSSGAGADSNSDFFMPRIQGTIDDIIRASGIAYTLTKPASFMQNFVNFFSNDIKNGVVYQPVGQGKMGWVDVRDIAAVNTQVLIHPEKYINQELTITGSENLSYAEALKLISKTIGEPIDFVDIPDEKANAAMKSYGMPPFSIDMLSSLNQIIKAGYAEGVTTTVQNVTGEKPISFEQFANDYQSNWK